MNTKEKTCIDKLQESQEIIRKDEIEEVDLMRLLENGRIEISTSAVSRIYLYTLDGDLRADLITTDREGDPDIAESYPVRYIIT